MKNNELLHCIKCLKLVANGPEAPTTCASCGGEVRVFTAGIRPKEAIAMLPSGRRVHTFTQNGFGADWKREDVIEQIEIYGAEFTGRMATAMGHGICIRRPDPMITIMVQTKKAGN